MAFIDILLIIFLFIGTFKGLRNGLFVELASLIGIFLGLWVALKFSNVTRDFFGQHLGSNPKTAYVIAFIITMVAVVVAISLMAKVLTKVADFSGIGIFNSIGGALFGFIRMALVLSVLLNIFDKVNIMETFASRETLDKSKVYGPLKASAEIVYPFLKEELHEIRIDLSK
ncbi:CvpA family protein [Flavobacterium selenitireducens]|uniref:CvpA family protein n=1 Tax=Flavobacterium selenitireducens TaxID=2722704 RepID=UPI00168AEF3A|nr:CvpA family protein [Flavobacterium selenitireducens]